MCIVDETGHIFAECEVPMGTYQFTLSPSIVEHTPWLNAQQGAGLSCMHIREVFARNLRKARNAKGLSQEALAHEADVDRTYISALERGVYSATIDMVDKLATVLDIEASALLQRQTKLRSRKT